ncbi:MAG TPA: hypothetical protein DEB31_00100 [Clostridiales bacterium]|nr:hypothetical protein [Clostridiales bacterium]
MKKSLIVCVILVLLLALTGCIPFLNVGREETETPGLPSRLQGRETPAPPTPTQEVLTPPTESAEPVDENLYEDEYLGFSLTLLPGWQAEDGPFYSDGASIYIGTHNYAPDGAKVTVDYHYDMSMEAYADGLDSVLEGIAAEEGATLNIWARGESPVGMYDGYQITYSLLYPQGDVLTTTAYIADGGQGDCYMLYYGLGGDMSEDTAYATDAETIIHSLVLTGSQFDPDDLNMPTGTAEGASAVTDDFALNAGVLSPGDVAETYGTDYDELEEDGMLLFWYPNFNVAFARDDSGAYVMTGVDAIEETSPIAVGGVTVGMTLTEAQAAIESYGYRQNMDIWNGATTLYYEGYDEWGELVFVVINSQDGVVMMVRGTWGLAAEAAREAEMEQAGG